MDMKVSYLKGTSIYWHHLEGGFSLWCVPPSEFLHHLLCSSRGA